MLIKNINKHSFTTMIVDPDCDGFTSSAILMNYLNKVFPHFVSEIHYIMHSGKQHGIILDEIPEETKFLICADSASNNYEQHKILKDKGVDILIIDHHEAEKTSPDACVINNQLCDYPTKSLSGAGMVFKFCCYLDELLDTSYAKDLVDLASLGLVADVMSLKDFETKRIVEKGIENIKNPFIQTMIECNSFSIGNHLTPTGIAFYIAPYVNAVIRVGTQEEKMLVFESMLETKALELIPSTKRGCQGQMETRVEQACRTCSNVKSRQTKERDKSISAIEEIIQEDCLFDSKILVVLLPKKLECNKNLTGLVANVLMDRYKRPTLILNQTERDGEFWWEGSGRGYGIDDFKKVLEDCGLPSFGGYAEG